MRNLSCKIESNEHHLPKYSLAIQPVRGLRGQYESSIEYSTVPCTLWSTQAIQQDAWSSRCIGLNGTEWHAFYFLSRLYCMPGQGFESFQLTRRDGENHYGMP